jgi:hypothetical protein
VNLGRRDTLVGAYVCPQGVFAIECHRGAGAVEIGRTVSAPATLTTAAEAADHLANVLAARGITNARIAIAARGFGVVHHVLQLPPAKDDLLAPIVEREIRRLEPQLGPTVVDWKPLPALDAGQGDAPNQRSLLTIAAPRETAEQFEDRLRSAGCTLVHLTALPAAMQRLEEEFDTGDESAAMVAALPDGAFLGFFLAGGLRLVIEPPLQADALHDVGALAEEVELGVMFVRQQFRGATIAKLTIVGSDPAISDAEDVIGQRIGVPATHLSPSALSPASFAAFGAVLDARSARPLALSTGARRQTGTASVLHQASIAAVGVAVLLATWTTIDAVRAYSASRELVGVTRRLEQDSFGLEPLRTTAEQRKLIRDAQAALRFVADERADLQRTLTGLAFSVPVTMRLDSLQLERSGDGWRAIVNGDVTGASNANAVQSIHDFYQELPRRVRLTGLALDQLSYDESQSEDRSSHVRFQLSFAVPDPKD